MNKDQSPSADLPLSLTSGFIDYRTQSPLAYRPSLILNDPPRSKVIHTLIRELNECTSFEFSVAFITTGGVMMLLQSLYDAQKRGVKGKILTSDYLNFTEPEALRILYDKFDNIEIRMYRSDPFHAKGYIFHHEEKCSSVIIGSSNITDNALARNREWNVRLVSLDEGELLRKTREEFTLAWNKAYEVSPALIAQYETLRENIKQKQPSPSVLPEEEETFDEKKIVANSMQKEALRSLDALRERGENKAILISATGSGKTFLSAFDVRRFAPRKFLFIVHRQQIARESMHKFRQILSNSIKASLLGGSNHYDRDAVYTFAMIQTLSKDRTLHSFARDEFDYIVVDEVHKAGAPSYEKVLSYFTPKFLLGMTATPERSDGYDIFRLFDHNIAYEIRLNQALEADLLCPFHYYGISDLAIDDKHYEKLSLFALLKEDEKVRQIVEAIDRYSVPSIRRRGLIFVSRNKEASILSERLNKMGLSTLALSGEDSDDARNEAFDRLENGELEYLIAVDILNEGIDIPSLNQIIMLRPTQSAIIFIQQMGRGLRKHKGKKFLTVIDFIGNYQNNYLIPIALFGDTSYKKDNLRKLVSSGSLGIQGVSTVNFDAVAKERIYQSINTACITHKKLLKGEYIRVRAKIGRIPKMTDFITHGVMSPLLFLEKFKNYYSFKVEAEKEFLNTCTDKNQIQNDFQMDLSDIHLRSLNFFSRVLAFGIRPYETMIIAHLIKQETPLSFEILNNETESLYGFRLSRDSYDSALRILSNQFFPEGARNGYGNISYCTRRGDLVYISARFKDLLSNSVYKDELEDIIAISKHEYETSMLPKRQDDDLILYHKYSREEVCRMLNWTKDESGTIFGFKVHRETMTCPIFVTYHKKEDQIDSAINYYDRFENPETFIWETRTRVKIDSSEPKAIRNEEGPLRKLLFIQKNNDEGKKFYYMGDVSFISHEQHTKENDKGETLPVVRMRFAMHKSVPPDLYEYIETK
ncbi:MAG: DEAD/DEAH box helicase [Sphaerochaetaceae bacterium]|nr:DEAD/DEAH box helicase [Sphaerochaetaceae bacterium]